MNRTKGPIYKCMGVENEKPNRFQEKGRCFEFVRLQTIFMTPWERIISMTVPTIRSRRELSIRQSVDASEFDVMDA